MRRDDKLEIIYFDIILYSRKSDKLHEIIELLM